MSTSEQADAGHGSGGADEAKAGSELEPAALAWIARFAAALETPPPSEAEVLALLELAGTAAHASHRQAAPVACWLAARADVAPAQALERARDLAG